MPVFCIIVDCGSRSDRDKVSFFSVPTARKFAHATHLNSLSAVRRQRWIDAIGREGMTETILKYERVCSKHFITGKPASIEDVNNIDWVPSVNMGYDNVRHLSKRQCDDPKDRLRKKRVIEIIEIQVIDQEEPVAGSSGQNKSDISTTTNLTGNGIENQFEQVTFGSTRNGKLATSFVQSILTYDSLKQDNVKCQYYTGFDFRVLEIIFNEVIEFIPNDTVTFLEPFQQFLIVMIKLRLNFPFKDIAYRFNISNNTCSLYFRTIIECMYNRFRTLIIWPEHEEINKNVPEYFKEVFHDKTTVIVDSFEILIEKPSNYLTQQQSWSNCKHHHTIKFLIGITPQGTISYISEAWGGSTSDKHIVENSDFLNNINPNDVVLANKGILLSDYLATLGTKLGIHAFTKRKQLLYPLKIEETTKIVNLQIQIDRLIGMIKSRFMICKGPVPFSMLINDEDDVNIFDKIVVVCCALINISPPIV